MVANNEHLAEEHDLEQLVNTIRLGIVIKGFYRLFDNRLNLICERRKGMDASEWTEAVQDFARRHGWRARLDEAGSPVEFLLDR